MGGRQGLAVEVLPVGGLLSIEARSVPASVADPGLHRLNWSAQVRHQGGIHDRNDEEHKEHPSESGPENKEWSSHSVFFVLLISQKVYRKIVVMSTKICENFSPYLIDSKRFSSEKSPLQVLDKSLTDPRVSKAGRPDLYRSRTYSQILKHVLDRLYTANT